MYILLKYIHVNKFCNNDICISRDDIHNNLHYNQNLHNSMADTTRYDLMCICTIMAKTADFSMLPLLLEINVNNAKFCAEFGGAI